LFNSKEKQNAAPGKHLPWGGVFAVMDKFAVTPAGPY
jgi:hypothetical protein